MKLRFESKVILAPPCDQPSDSSRFGFVVTGVADPPVAGIRDQSFEGDVAVLGQNSPNPFTGSTCIAFAVPRGSRHVDVEIYNVNGQVVRTLAVDASSEAETSVVWDGKDTAGSRVASGVYFYRLNPGSGVFRKMVLLE